MKKKFLILIGISIGIILLIVGLFLFRSGKISIFNFTPNSLEGSSSALSFNPENNNLVGYEFLDNDKVVHIWNNKSDYFFNKSSGIQWTEHINDYWTKNIFCIGYYDGDEWIKINCADDLENFNRDIHTDNETYVNATLWKDINYGSYDLRLGINYYLELNDENLTIAIYGKNIGIDIPFDLGFAWRVKDIDIGKGINHIIINGTKYQLRNETITIDTCWNETITNCTIWDNSLPQLYECLEYGIPPEINLTVCDYTTSLTDINLSFSNLDNATYKLMANGDEYIRLNWNKNLPNKVIVQSNYETQYNSPVTLLINAGHFNPQQEKSTKIYWSDPTVAPNISFITPTPPNATTTSNTSIQINVSITDADLDEVKWNWNGTNFTMYDSSLVLMLNFDNVSALGENDTYVAGLSRYGNNGTSTNGAAVNTTDCKYGNCFTFDGIGDYIDLGDKDDFALNASGFTVSLWFKADAIPPASSGNRMWLIAKGDTNNYEWGMSINDFNNCLGKMSYTHWIPSGGNSIKTCTDSDMVADVWTHIAFTVADPSALANAYVNGVLDNGVIRDASMSTVPGSAPLLIGERADNVEHQFNGTIDEVRIWNRTLTADEISQQYMSNLNKFDTDKWVLYVNQSKNATVVLENATYTYYASAKDGSGNENLTEERTITIGSKGEYPQFSNYYDNNASLLNSGTGLFNVTLLSTNGTVWLEINNSNYTAFNTTANVYNITVPFTEGGTYPYRWHSWGNGTDENYNTSNERSYTVNDTIPPDISFVVSTPPNDTTTVNTSIQINVSIIEKNLDEFKCN